MSVRAAHLLLCVLWALSSVYYSLLAEVASWNLATTLLAVACGQYCIGETVAKLTHDLFGHPQDAATRFLMGGIAFSLLLLLMIFGSRWMGFALLLIVATFCLALRKGVTKDDPNPVCRDEESASLIAVVLMALAALVSAYWCAGPLSAVPLGFSAYDTLVGADAPFHAAYIDALSTALRTGVYADIHGAGLSTQSYHYGVYALAALVQNLSGTPSLAMVQIVTAWGGLWLALALFTLARLLTPQPLVAAMATLLVLALPDFGWLPFGHPVFGFQWLRHVGVAINAGLAVALLAWATMIHACRKGSLGILLIAWFLGLTVAVFKAQIFIVVAIPLFLFPAFAWRSTPLVTRGLVVVAMLLAVAGVTWVASFYDALPLIRLDFSVAQAFLQAMSLHAPPWSLRLLAGAAGAPAVVSIPIVACVLTIFLAGNGLIMLLTASFVNTHVVRSQFARNALLWGLGASYIAAAVGLSGDSHMATGGPLEVQLQGQVWGYAAFTLGAALVVVHAVTFRWPKYGYAFIGLTVLAIGFLFLAPAQHAQRSAGIAQPSLSGGPDSDAIARLRQALPTCGLLQVADGDPMFVWQAAIGRRAWAVNYALNPRPREEVRVRTLALQAMNAMPTLQARVHWAMQRGITMYVHPENSGPIDTGGLPATAAGEGFRAWSFEDRTDCASK